MKLSILSVLCAVATATGVASAAPIFIDSFEDPRVSSWSVFQTGVGDTGAWTNVGGTGIEIQRNGTLRGVSAFDGQQYVELDSDSRRGGVNASTTNSMMAAAVDFQAGTTYTISFAYRPRTNNGGDDNGIELSVGNVNGSTFALMESLVKVATTTSTQCGWDIISVVFTAIDGMNGIAFGAFGKTNSLGGLIDYVSVSADPVPLPAAGLLFVGGAAIFSSLSRRKRAVA